MVSGFQTVELERWGYGLRFRVQNELRDFLVGHSQRGGVFRGGLLKNRGHQIAVEFSGEAAVNPAVQGQRGLSLVGWRPLATVDGHQPAPGGIDGDSSRWWPSLALQFAERLDAAVAGDNVAGGRVDRHRRPESVALEGSREALDLVPALRVVGQEAELGEQGQSVVRWVAHTRWRWARSRRFRISAHHAGEPI